MKTLLVTLEIDVDDLDEATRAQCAKDMECSVDEIPDLSEVSPAELGNLLEGIGMEGSVEYFFAGSDIYAAFTECRIINADWKEQPAAAPSLSVDQVRQTIADEWGSHLCYRDSFGTRSCSQDTSGLLACRCNDIARAILSTYTLTPMPAADPVAAADKEHADLLRRLAAVPKEEKE